MQNRAVSSGFPYDKQVIIRSHEFRFPFDNEGDYKATLEIILGLDLKAPILSPQWKLRGPDPPKLILEYTRTLKSMLMLPG